MCPQKKDERVMMFNIPYASTVRSLMYTMICTRVDISIVVSVTSLYQSDSGDSHWMAIKYVLKYFKGTKDKFFIYGENNLQMRKCTKSNF